MTKKKKIAAKIKENLSFTYITQRKSRNKIDFNEAIKSFFDGLTLAIDLIGLVSKQWRNCLFLNVCNIMRLQDIRDLTDGKPRATVTHVDDSFTCGSYLYSVESVCQREIRTALQLCVCQFDLFGHPTNGSSDVLDYLSGQQHYL